MGLSALILTGAMPARAADLIAPDPWQVIHKVRALGPAEVGRDDFRDPQITATLKRRDDAAPSLPYTITFYGCWLGRKCTSVLLSMRLASPDGVRPPSPRTLATWNRTRLLGRAWLDDRDRAVLDHAVVIGAGLPDHTLAATLDAWAAAMYEFAEHIDFETE